LLKMFDKLRTLPAYLDFVSASLMTARCAGLSVFISQHRLPGQLDLVAILADAFDHDLLAFTQLVTNVADAAVRNLGDLQQPVGPRKDLDKRSEIHEPRHRAYIGLTHFGLGGYAA